MSTPKVKIKRDFKTPITGLLSLVVLIAAFVCLYEIVIVVLRLIAG